MSEPQSLCWEKWMTVLVVENPQSLKELIGKEIGVTEWFRVTQERIEKFAEATEDRQWIHLDEARAIKESPYGATIAHGFLTLSLISHLMKGLVHIRSGVRLAVNYGLNRVRFPAAVRAGSRIRARVRLLSLRELADSIEATFDVMIELEGSEKPGCVAEWIVRYYL
jgi:acyl dehydratase